MMASQTLKEKFVELQSKQTPQNSRPKIQRVPYYRRRMSNLGKHYTPKLLSIGPIHHDRSDLKLGEKYKLKWAAEYIENTALNPEELHQKIADNIDELKGRFSDDVLTLTGKSLEGFHSLEEKLSWMLFVDGCSLLYLLEKGHMKIKVGQLVLVMMDVLLLENQLPYEVLKLLWKNNESELIKCMMSFPNYLRNIPGESQSDNNMEGEGEHSVSIITNESQSETPTHLLDLQHKVILTTSKSKGKILKWTSLKKNEFKPITYRMVYCKTDYSCNLCEQPCSL
uniref:DUF247 domain protein n=1 Tax=Medicago truncatula TaxID=3880 RepID=I3SJ49_MEDTR|nr:unknown [Medicago truncatula]